MRYPLAGLLALKEREERVRASERAAAARQVARALSEREAREEAARREEACGAPVGVRGGDEAWAWQAASRFAARCRESRAAAAVRLAEAQAALDRARASLEATRGLLAAAVSHRSAVERHRESWREARRRADGRADEIEREEARAGTEEP